VRACMRVCVYVRVCACVRVCEGVQDVVGLVTLAYCM